MTGDLVSWLNADDELMPGALHTVAAYFNKHPEAMLVYGDAETIDARGRSYGRRGNVRAASFADLSQAGDFIVQPAAFWRAHLLAEVGLLDETLTYCLDYEYWLRIAQKYALHYLPVRLARERFHPGAKTTTAGLRRMEEIEAVARRYGGPGLPRRFTAERTAVYLVESLKQARSSNWSQAAHFIQSAGRDFPPSPRVLPHLVALLLGPWVVSQMRLYYDLMRSIGMRVNADKPEA